MNGTKFYFDYQDGQYGYNTDPERGADTFSPFNLISDIEQVSIGNNTILTLSKDYTVLVVMHYSVVGNKILYNEVTQQPLITYNYVSLHIFTHCKQNDTIYGPNQMAIYGL